MAAKKGQEGLNPQLALVMKSGKSSIGYKQSMKALRGGKAKALIISSNLPIVRKSELEYLAVLAKIKTIEFQGTNSDLGTACGKLYRISCMAVEDAGDSDILVES